MDETDYRILSLLQQNGRASHESIGREVHLSRPAVRSRILAMEKEGIIQGYSALIDYNKLGYPIHVLIYLKLSHITYRETMEHLEKLENPHIKCYSHYRISGEWSILLKVMSKTQEGLTRYLDDLQETEGVMATRTVFLLK